MFEREIPGRHAWLPSALPLYYGAEPERSDPWPVLLDFATQLRTVVADVRVDALSAAAELGGKYDDPFPACAASSSRLTEIDREAPMRVVLMGRTMAGKSSLLAALAGSHPARLADGTILARHSRGAHDGVQPDRGRRYSGRRSSRRYRRH